MRSAVATLALLMAAWPSMALDPAKPLSSYQRQTWQTESGLPQNTVHAILQTHDGYLWLGTEGGLVRFDGVKFTVYDSQNTPAIRSNNVRALLEDREKSLWIATADGLTVFRAGGEKLVFTRDQGLPNDSVWSITQDSGGRISLLTASGPAEYRNGRFEGHETKENAEGNNATEVKDSQGALWLANRGVKRIVNGKVENFPANDPLASEVILSMFEDREGDIWLGSESNGLTVLRDPKVTTFTANAGLTDDLVRCVYQDRAGVIWLGTNAGLTKMAGGKVSRFTVEDGLSSNLVFAIGETAAGDLLVGTQDGLNVIHNRSVKLLTTADGLADDLVRSLHTDTDGSIWIGTRRGLTVLRGSTFHTYTKADGLGDDFVGALTRTRDGSLWVGTLRGVTRIKEGRFKTFGSNIVTALHEDSSGVLWIGTQDGGLQSMRNGEMVRYSATLGLPASIYSLIEEGAFIWMTSKSGIFRVAKSEFAAPGAELAIAQYGTADGMRVNECSEGGHPAAWRAKDGTLWFATLRGVSTIDSRAANSRGLAPSVAIESLSVDGSAVDAKMAENIPPGHDRLSFEYTGISFISPQRVRFQYKLEGFDRAWVNAGTRRAAYYTSLAPGQYRFKVTARANDGEWSKAEATLTFRLLPRFYQTYWFYSMVVAALGLSIYLFYRWRLSLVEARFHAVLGERNRIAREIHDTLAQGFVAVSLQLELLARKLENTPADVTALIKQIRDSVQNGLSDARRSIWELRSQGSEDLDFRARLLKMATDITDRSAVKMQYEVLGTYRALPEKIESELLKIGQEALTNVVRHANARLVKIDLAYEDKLVRMTIADDGGGFENNVNSSGPEGHFGLRGMRERAAAIDAELHIKSRLGEGTQIDVEKMVQ
jgi:signal transduction histidine kinase/ligand-binding sensor domain-containing protein